MLATATCYCAWRLAPFAVCPERTPILSAADFLSHPFRDFSSPPGSSTLACQPWFYLRLQAQIACGLRLSLVIRGGIQLLVVLSACLRRRSDTIQLDTLPRTFILSDVNKDHSGSAPTSIASWQVSLRAAFSLMAHANRFTARSASNGSPCFQIASVMAASLRVTVKRASAALIPLATSAS